MHTSVRPGTTFVGRDFWIFYVGRWDRGQGSNWYHRYDIVSYDGIMLLVSGRTEDPLAS